MIASLTLALQVLNVEQHREAWLLEKEDMQIGEVFHFVVLGGWILCGLILRKQYESRQDMTSNKIMIFFITKKMYTSSYCYQVNRQKQNEAKNNLTTLALTRELFALNRFIHHTKFPFIAVSWMR